ncbi:MAG: hypothetical protein U1A78_41130 [Polyangia bacterium]
MALTMYSADATARKKKKPAAEEPAAAPAPEQPPPAAEKPATTATPTTADQAPAAAASASVSVGTSTEAAVPAETSPAAAATPAAPAAPPPPVRPPDGVRFRGGISLGGGGEFVSGFTAGLGGLDGRLGVQINKLVGVYLQPHFSAGAGSIGNVSGATATAAATVLADFTFIDRIFVGAGAGYGLVNNPHGAAIHFRFGGYPLMKFSEVAPRRKGLMVGADLRTYFTQVGPVVQFMAAVGYEAY